MQRAVFFFFWLFSVVLPAGHRRATNARARSKHLKNGHSYKYDNETAHGVLENNDQLKLYIIDTTHYEIMLLKIVATRVRISVHIDELLLLLLLLHTAD